MRLSRHGGRQRQEQLNAPVKRQTRIRLVRTATAIAPVTCTVLCPLSYLLRASRHPLLPLFAHTLLASHELPLQHPEYRTTPARIRSKPHIVNVQAFQGVNASVVAGTPVDPLAVVNAENTVEFLSGAESKNLFSYISRTNNFFSGFAGCHHKRSY